MKKNIILLFLCAFFIPILISKLLIRNGAELKNHPPKAVQTSNGSAAKPAQQNATDSDRIVGDLVDSERLIRELNPALVELNRAVRNLELGYSTGIELFSAECSVIDIKSIQLATNNKQQQDSGCRVELSDIREIDTGEQLWSALLSRVDYFQSSKFYAIRVSDRAGLPEAFTTEVGFDALGRTSDNSWLAIMAHGQLEWTRNSNGQWMISGWKINQFDIQESKQQLFENVTEKCLSEADSKTVRHSKHFEILNGMLTRQPRVFTNLTQKKYFPHIATGRHPSVAIADVDGDGWDDLYVVEQWRKNLLFRNQGDGTFLEMAGEFNLDLPGNSTSALFADFDNDGDKDLFVGQSLDRSLYLENIGGKYVDRSKERFSTSLPFLVSSLSACDYNGDGLLDLYVSTYGFLAPRLRPGEWTRSFLPEVERKKVMQLFRSPQHNRYFNATGPANILYENCGDHFEISKHNPQVKFYKNTLQATWADYDNDGDSDIYVANDFARDYLIRNNGDEGFEDVTLTVGDQTMMGFGMGAAWGDYDLDGRQDLYVSNMYSKAGIRIVEQFGELDQQFRRSADGNRLYKNSESGLKLASANEGPGINVHKAGWSWGGQFVDVNNDGYLDIYVTSGYFTAPKRFASDKDL